MKSSFTKIAAAIGLVSALVAPAAHAAIGDSLVVAKDGDVTITFNGSDAFYDSTVGVTGVVSGLFPNHATAVGSSYNLGTFSAGTVLDVVLNVSSTFQSYHTGAGSMNPDGVAHALLTPVKGGTQVAFEDLWGGGDRDFNDHIFTVSNTAPVPEPETYALMLAGLGVMGVVARRRTGKQV